MPLGTPLITEYKGNPMIVLNPNERFQFQFGLSKAKMIVAQFDAIKAFAEGKSLSNAPEMANTANVTADVSAMAQAHIQQYAADDNDNLM